MGNDILSIRSAQLRACTPQTWLCACADPIIAPPCSCCIGDSITSSEGSIAGKCSLFIVESTNMREKPVRIFCLRQGDSTYCLVNLQLIGKCRGDPCCGRPAH